MTREEAIDVLKHNYPSACFTELCDAVEMAIQALKHASTIDLDSIIAEHEDIGYEKGRRDGFAEAIEEAEPVRHGKWMKKPAYKGAEFNIYTCSECGEPWWFTMKYCGNCGAKMDSNDSNALNALNALEIDEVNDE